MADKNWRQNPEILAADVFRKRFRKKAVIVLHFDGEGHFGFASSGWDDASPKRGKELCDAAGRLGKEIMDAICNGNLDARGLG